MVLSVAEVLDSEPGNVSADPAAKFAYCVLFLGKPKPLIQSCSSLKLFKFSSTKNDMSRLPYVTLSPGIG